MTPAPRTNALLLVPSLMQRLVLSVCPALATLNCACFRPAFRAFAAILPSGSGLQLCLARWLHADQQLTAQPPFPDIALLLSVP